MGRDHRHRLAEPGPRPVRRHHARRLRYGTVAFRHGRDPTPRPGIPPPSPPVAASVQEATGGRFVLGIGRGDAALFHLGRRPHARGRVRSPPRRPAHLPGRGARWTAGGPPQPHPVVGRARARVPVDVAVSGPRMIDLAAGVAERITFGLGAQPERLAWALDRARKAAAEAGRPDGDIGFRRLPQRRLPPRPGRGPTPSSPAAWPPSPTSRPCPARPARGSTTPTAPWSPRWGGATTAGSTCATTPATPRRSTPNFVDRFAVVGPPDRVRRAHRRAGRTGHRPLRADRAQPGCRVWEEARRANRLLARELLPALRG